MARDDGMMNAGEGEVESRGPQMEAVACIFLAITWFFVILRVWVRGFMIKSWGWDDTTMIVTLVRSEPILLSTCHLEQV